MEILHCAEGYQLTGATPTAVQYCPSQGIKEVNNSCIQCVPTFMTPKREGLASKRGGPKDDKEVKKGRKEDTTQKKLEDYFSGAANNSLQLTN